MALYDLEICHNCLNPRHSHYTRPVFSDLEAETEHYAEDGVPCKNFWSIIDAKRNLSHKRSCIICVSDTEDTDE